MNENGSHKRDGVYGVGKDETTDWKNLFAQRIHIKFHIKSLVQYSVEIECLYQKNH